MNQSDNLSENFTYGELACHCGCGMIPQKEFIDRTQNLRTRYGKALHVTSGARCPAYNAKVSHTGTTGPHTTGRAVDFLIRGHEAYELLSLAFIDGFTGIGVSQKGDSRFLHLDDLPDAEGQPRPWVWSY